MRRIPPFPQRTKQRSFEQFFKIPSRRYFRVISDPDRRHLIRQIILNNERELRT